MLPTLAFRHLRVKKLRSLFLLLGYGLGVGVMVVLLSVGQAMLDQSRDVSLVGGGEVTILPQGIDVEAMRTGGVSGMFFGIERARFLTRQVLGGARHRELVLGVSPLIEHKLVYVAFGGDTVAARAGGEVPSRTRAVGAPIRLLAGRWEDSAADSAYAVPTAQQLYDDLDRFHTPVADPSWAEWHYFNLVTGEREWWYVTFLVGGDIPGGRGGGQFLVSRRNPEGGYDRFRAVIPPEQVVFDTARADVSLGPYAVRQRDGVYVVRGAGSGAGGRVALDLTVAPEPNRYFPPVELREGAYPSGYVVPALSGRAKGRICLNARCATVRDAPAYHDHNWGVWRDVTWEWGAVRGAQFNLLYGAVITPEDRALGAGSRPSLFVALVDSLGVRQVFRASQVRYFGPDGQALPRGRYPAALAFTAVRERDTLELRAEIADVAATRETPAGPGWVFLQMRGPFMLRGRSAGAAVADQGAGFFETYVPAGPAP